MFHDRDDAGQQLAETIQERGIKADLVVAIPRGGLPLGRAVADELGVSLDVVVAAKIGAPWNEELAIGTVASDGTAWLNESILTHYDVSERFIERGKHRKQATAKQKEREYRPDRPPLDVAGKVVMIVDDGIATGATMRACINQLQEGDASQIIVAVPVAPPETVTDLQHVVDEVICLHAPSMFGAVGAFYDDFSQVSDEQAIAYLHE